MSPEFTAFLGQLGIAAIFVVAWFREQSENDRLRIEKDKEISRLNQQMVEMQTAHRREIMELIRDIVAGRAVERSLPDR